MYDAELIESSKTINNPSNIFECCDNLRDEKMNQWLIERQKIGIGTCQNSIIPMVHLTETSRKGLLEGGILQHLMETNSKENNQHFSEILFLDGNFQCISKISMFGDTKVFFKTLCTLSNEILEMDFDGFCWKLYSIFAEQFNKIIAVTETKWGMHCRVLELLQSKKYSKLVAKLQ
jgi:hypothetical protein